MYKQRADYETLFNNHMQALSDLSVLNSFFSEGEYANTLEHAEILRKIAGVYATLGDIENTMFYLDQADIIYSEKLLPSEYVKKCPLLAKALYLAVKRSSIKQDYMSIITLHKQYPIIETGEM